MKRREFLIGAPLLAVGCASWMKPSGEGEGEMSPELVSYLVNTAGFAVGAAVAGMAPEIDTTLRAIYNVASEGKLDTVALNNLVTSMLDGEDLMTKVLANRILELVKLFGGTLTGNMVIELGELDPGLMQSLSDGYVSGYDTFQLEVRRRGVA